MKVTVCQWDSRPEQLEGQLQALIDHCAAQDSELLILPEMPFDDWLAGSQDVDAARWLASMQRHLDGIECFSRNLKLPLLASRPVLDGLGVRRNRAFCWMQAEGLMDGHDKLHLPDELGYWEARWYQAGSPPLKIFDLGVCRAGVLICSELWFFRACAALWAAASAPALSVARDIFSGYRQLDRSWQERCGSGRCLLPVIESVATCWCFT